MDKRYQVFVSSTYVDLQEERQHVFTTLMEMDCIPAGMELFPAMDEEQWAFIQRVINDCDYYVLILGGRYGSLTAEGISYTEKEYDYAISIGLKVVALVHGAPEKISVENSDIEPAIKEKLDLFRAKVCEDRLVKFWKSASELPGIVMLSLTKTIRAYPAVGWVRADSVANDDALIDLNNLRKDNAEMKETLVQLKSINQSGIEGLASLEELFEVKIGWTVFNSSVGKRYEKNANIEISWGDLFSCIAPELQNYLNNDTVIMKLGAALFRTLNSGKASLINVNHDDFQTIKVQFQALGLIELSYLKTVKDGMGTFWKLSNKGTKLMLQLRSVKASSNIQS